MNSITVIPFEWNDNGEYTHLAGNVTAAITNGVINGISGKNINYVNPDILKYVPNHQFWRYVEVYITGRITNIFYSDSYQANDSGRRRERHRSRDERRQNENQHSRNESGHSERTVTDTVYRTVTVEIEYTYIRASHQEILGHFNKSQTSSSYFVQERNFNRRYTQQTERSGRSHRHGDQQVNNRASWTDNAAAEAISQFRNTVSHELGPWTSTEERTLKGKIGGDPELAEALKMIRKSYYGRAFGIYSDLYESTGDILAGYNLAVLLQFDNQYEDALELLEEIQEREMQSGKKTPSYITAEIETLKGFIEGFKVLEGYGEEF